MKKEYFYFLTSLMFFCLHVKAQSVFENKTQVSASDGTVYKLRKIGSGSGIYIQNTSNILHTEVKKHPDTRNEFARTSEFYPNHFTTPLNKLFSKTQLQVFKSTRLRIFAIADRTGTIREVNFFISKGTAITVDDLRRIELMIKKEKIGFAKYQKSGPDARGNSRYVQIRNATINDIPEFNGIPYFAINTFIDFDYAYRAVMRIRDPGSRPSRGEPTGPDTIWVVPVTR
ncbi:hypothetical protein RYH73_19745 [Olivibacter sp. CPCC 100613]|uniref:hypothetical protein n=1 Tax=Olivibacter sp. CPCC 100613 TaxID=3079931 RepID=UPI002FF59EF4